MTKGPETAPEMHTPEELHDHPSVEEVDELLDSAEVESQIQESVEATYFSGGRMNINDALDDLDIVKSELGDYETESAIWDYYQEMWNRMLRGMTGMSDLDVEAKAPKLSFKGFEFPGGVKPVVTSMPQAWRDVEGNGASAHGGHEGVDIAVPLGTDILMAQPVKIISAYGNEETGRTVKVQYPDGSTASFGHMNSIAVSVGDTLAAGESIGEVGSSGNSTGPHVHYQTYNSNGTLRDPFTSFDARLAGVDLSGYEYPFEGMTRREARNHSASSHRHA